ncbi:septation inhibitor protein [Intrasporangium oryzae NRRL B-24470]|uniref:Cell division protein CrgA n=1 Tax=Intrasporangium oryzae NRRL B-24470 TaxID=1386089 RepID=W9G2Y2_9MICO|nr:cell division protein CrgA [Intrasporangium oryzae]EWT00360.1 septation inhibitor protein [Intrasporangium oryzae NRRL B-24470]
MPESRGRDRKAAPYIPPKSSKATEPNPTWWAPVFITLLVLGLLWIVVYYISASQYPIGSIGVWNLAIGFALLMGGFIMTMRWR